MGKHVERREIKRQITIRERKLMQAVKKIQGVQKKVLH